MEYKKELSIIIVNYKNYSLTIKCVNSVVENLSSLDYEIIIIDNNSPNDSFEQINSVFNDNDKIKIIKNKH